MGLTSSPVANPSVGLDSLQISEKFLRDYARLWQAQGRVEFRFSFGKPVPKRGKENELGLQEIKKGAIRLLTSTIMN